LKKEEHMNRNVIGPVLVIAVLLMSACMPVQAQSGTQGATTGDTTTATGAGTTRDVTVEMKIEEAMRAAGPAISQDATIMDWPTERGGEFTVLREGSNSWTCLPSPWPEGVGHPMCVDKVWLATLKAQWAHEDPPQVTVPGIAYMLDGGGGPSITDPYATEPPPGQDWGRGGPHVMILTPGDLSGYSHTLGVPPWVMYPDTPFAHLMVGVQMPEK
jgi:hypothetical protein